MKNALNYFNVEDAFYIKSRNSLVLIGELHGQFSIGDKILFTNGICWPIKSIEFVNIFNKQGKIGLLVSLPVISRQELVSYGIIGASAQLITKQAIPFISMYLVRTTSENLDFRPLVQLLDQDLAARDGSEHAFYAQFNQVAQLNHVVVAYQDGTPVGCGAFKEYAADLVEIKRMYVQPAYRQQGVARAVLAELEQWASELGYAGCVLETGKRQPEAIALYERSGYAFIPNYGQYVGVDNSVCLQKMLGQ